MPTTKLIDKRKNLSDKSHEVFLKYFTNPLFENLFKKNKI